MNDVTRKEISDAIAADLARFKADAVAAAAVGGRNQANANALSTVPPIPFAQTTPAANTGILACVLTPKLSGIFLVAFKVAFTQSGAGIVTWKVRRRQKTVATAVVLGNATATGRNGFFATANGPITYDADFGAAGTLFAETQQMVAANLQDSFDWTGAAIATIAGGGIGLPVAFEVAVEQAANNITGMTGSILAFELPAP